MSAYGSYEEQGSSGSGLDLFGMAAPLAGAYMVNAARNRYVTSLPMASRVPGFQGAALRWSTRGQPGIFRKAVASGIGSRMEKQAALTFERRAMDLGRSAYNLARSTDPGARGFFRSLRAGFGAMGQVPGGRMVLMARAGAALETLGGVAFAVPLAVGLGKAVGSGLSMIGGEYSRPNWGTPFMDTQEAATQRQAGLQAIHNSQLQTRSFFMREAQAFHR